MIIKNPDVGRYTFILDLNDGKSFSGIKYNPDINLEWKPVLYSLPDNLKYSFPDHFREMTSWLSEHTSAFRVMIIGMMAHKTSAVTAVSVEVPEDLALMFRLFWYD